MRRLCTFAAIITSDQWAHVVVTLKLSPRQQQIVECVLGGTDGEVQIAEQLRMSSKTLHTHMERLYRKLSVTSRSQLLARVFLAYALHVHTESSDKQSAT